MNHAEIRCTGKKTMNKILVTTATLGVCLCLSANSSASVIEKAFNGVEFGSSAVAVVERIQEQCDEVETLNVEPPVIPIARQREAHVLCRNYQSGDGLSIGEVVFVFGDDSLALIEAREGAVAALSALAGSEPSQFQDYSVYFEDMLLTQPGEDAAWLLTPESLQPHMFLWRNPVLAANASSARPFEQSAEIPAVLQFGSSIDKLEPLLENSCDMTSREEIEEVWLPSNPSSQTQINCYGYDYAGFPRKIEAIFGDGILQVAWILTGAGEEDRLRQSLVRAYGPAQSDNGVYEVFNDGRVALRKDKPEVLMLAEDLVPLYREEFSTEQRDRQ